MIWFGLDSGVGMQPDYQPSKPAIFQFWGGMFGLAVYWIVMTVFAVSKPKYLILTLMALFFIATNVLGYYRCRTWSSQMIKASQTSAGAHLKMRLCGRRHS